MKCAMMKILIACKEFPHSKVIGGPILIYNRLKYLAKNHRDFFTSPVPHYFLRIPASDGKNIILADRPDDFVKGIAELFGDTDLYRTIQTNARKLMEDRYAWEKGVAILEEVLEDMMSKPPSDQTEGRK